MNNLQFTEQAEFRQCFKCHYEAVTAQTVCPRCNKTAFFTASSIRKRGAVVIVVGLFLAGLMGVIAIVVGMLLLGQVKDPASAQRMADDQLTFLAIFGLFGLLIALGLQFVVTGGWMAAFGRRSRVLIRIMWGFLFLVFLVGGVVMALVN